jgi:hypothetical protein
VLREIDKKFEEYRGVSGEHFEKVKAALKINSCQVFNEESRET